MPLPRALRGPGRVRVAIVDALGTLVALPDALLALAVVAAALGAGVVLAVIGAGAFGVADLALTGLSAVAALVAAFMVFSW